MASPNSPTPKNRYWFVVLALLSGAVVVVMATLFYLLLTFPTRPPPTPSRSSPSALKLPPATSIAATPGLPQPVDLLFIAEEPITGFSNCNGYGFKGTVTDSDETSLANVQVVVWTEEAELLALDSTTTNGTYLIDIQESPPQRTFWVQIYQNDIPVSRPVLVQIQTDCQNGFQLYQIDWHKLPVEKTE